MIYDDVTHVQFNEVEFVVQAAALIWICCM